MVVLIKVNKNYRYFNVASCSEFDVLHDNKCMSRTINEIPL